MNRLAGGSIPKTPSHAPWLVMALVAGLVAATVAVYLGVTWNDFVSFDDGEYITDNYHVLQGLSVANVKWAFGFHAGNWHPLTWLSHMLDIEMFGTWPGGHHLVNLALHIASTLMLFAFLRWTTKCPWASIFVAALFALHPLHVESVAWASERKDTLSTFFWMATMLAYAWYAGKPGIARYCCIALLFALGLAAKPMLVTLPPALLLLDYWPLNRFSPERIWKKRTLGLIAEKLPLLAMSIGAAALTLAAQEDAMVSVGTVDIATRLMNAILSYGRYAWKMVWPLDLGVYYPYPQTPIQYKAAVGLAVMAAVTAVVFYLGNRRRYLPAGWLWYLGTLVPVIGLVQVASQSHADRYTYIPLIGLFIIIAWSVRDIVEWRPWLKTPAAVAAVAVLAAATLLTYRQVGYWKDTFTLFSRTVAVTEDNGYIRMAFGKMYCSLGEYDKAEAQLLESLKTMPDSETLYTLGTVMRKTGRLEEAIRYYGQSLILDPKLIEANYNAGVLLHDMGRHKEAELYFRRAVKLDPSWPEAHCGLALTLAAMGSTDEALAVCREAIRIDPKLPAARRVLASILAGMGDHKGAADEYRTSLAMEPDYAASVNLAESLLYLGEFAEAERSALQAIGLDPDKADAYRNLAMAMDKLGRRDEAIVAARQAVSLDPNDAAASRYYRELTGAK